MYKPKLLMFFTLLMISTFCSISVKAGVAFAADSTIDVPVTSYESDERYGFANSVPVISMTFGGKSLGALQISGDVSGTAEYEGKPAYGVESENLTFSYRYDTSLLNEKDEQWHITADSGKIIEGMNLNKPISSGVLLVQTSVDQKTWSDAIEPVHNLFMDNPTGIEALYETNSIDINSGTFYRVIVAYQTGRKTGSTNLLVYQKDNYIYRYHAEVYEFYASTNSGIIKIHDLAVGISEVSIEAKAHESSKQYYLDDSAPVQTMSFGKKSLGDMLISGQIASASSSQNMSSYELARGKVNFSYQYDGFMLNDESDRNINSAPTDSIAGISLGAKMGKGALIVQKSMDGTTWENALPPTVNFLENYDAASPIFYTTDESDVEKGCFYRIILAYETRKKTGTTNLLVTQRENYEYHKHVEVYTFHLSMSNEKLSIDLYGADNANASCGFEIDLLGAPYAVYVDDVPAHQGQRIVEKGDHVISITSIYGKEITKTIHVINGQDAAVGVLKEPEDLNTVLPPEPTASQDNSKYYLGSAKNTGNDNGYSKPKAITGADLHFGWDIGRFFVSGFTRVVNDTSGNPVFLKVPGDKVALWFTLDQDIRALNGKNSLFVIDDNGGYDEYFGVERTDFGQGALIIKHTDYQNSAEKPVIYTDYLSAKAVQNADATVELFEEGDYEVALNYKIMQDNSLIDKYESYRIYYKFSVRNGNCMVYPFDMATKAELTNSAITENGFYLDLARSRYLDVTIKKESLVEGASGLIEDTRFNRPAKDGDQYTDEGIYTIAVRNRYTDEKTTKKIFVGSSEALKKYLDNGLKIEEIQSRK